MTPVEAYNILLQRQMNEDRILVERTSIFLLATAFLFLAFVILLDPDLTAPIVELLRVLLPSVGIFLAILLFSFNQSASRALVFWHMAQRKIEEEAAEFDYMRSNDITPHIAQEDFRQGKKDWIRDENGKLVLTTLAKPRGWSERRLLKNRVIYKWCLPIAFLALWVAALVVAAVS